jgi:small subunit ribosomal protein S8
MVNDPIGDLLAQIKNASMAGLQVIELPNSRMKLAVAKILSQEGYVGEVSTVGDEPKRMLRIGIKYQGDEPVITGVKRISKPGLRLYVNRNTIPTVVGGMGMALVSTPQGIMTGRDAKKKGIGGEILCTIW